MDDDDDESPAGRQSDPVYGRESVCVRERECVVLLFVAAAARALLLFTFLYFNFDAIHTSCC